MQIRRSGRPSGIHGPTLVTAAVLSLLALGSMAQVQTLFSDNFESSAHPGGSHTTSDPNALTVYSRNASGGSAVIANDATFGSNALTLTDTDGASGTSYAIIMNLPYRLTLNNVGDSLTVNFKFHYVNNATATANGNTVPAGAAGGHFDPQHTGAHAGPQGSGHLGDLPVLQVAANGTATETLTAPRIIDVAALRGKALMIHVGGDNYSDQPAPLGGGGARIACGVLQ